MKKINQCKANLLRGATSFLVVSCVVANGAAALAATVTVPTVTGVMTNDAVTSTEADQANTATSVSATVSNLEASRVADGAIGSTVTLDANEFGAAAVGNTAPRSVSRVGLASLSDSAGLVVRQVNTDAPVSAETTGSDFSVLVGNAGASNGTGVVTGSAVSVSGNADTASATGNSAVQALSLDATTLAVGTSAASQIADGTELAVSVAGASTSSVQVNDGSAVNANNSGSAITLRNADDVGLSAGTSLAIDGNTQGASATGSTSSSSVNLSGTTLSGGSGVLNVQQNLGSASAATLTGAGAQLIIENTTEGAAAQVAGTTQQAVATGMAAVNALSASAATLTLGSGSAELATTGTAELTAAGAALVSNLQGSDASSGVTATNAAAAVGLTVSDANGVSSASTFTVAGNVQQAIAAGMTSANSVMLDGATVGSGVGASNVQNGLAPVTAVVSGAASLGISADTAGSALELTGNRLQATATNASATNSVTVNATSIALAAADELGAEVSASGAEARAAYAALNVQTVGGDVSASALPTTGGAAFTASVDGSVTAGSSLSNDRNGIVSRAQAATATNSLDLTIGGTLATVADADGVTFANTAAVINAQTVSAGTDVSASAAPSGANAVLTAVGDALSGSSLSTSGNRLQAFADGANATNTLKVTSGTLTAAGGADTADYTAAGMASSNTGTLSVDAAFALANSQSGDGTVSASLRDPAYTDLDTPGVSAANPVIRTELGGAVTDSAVAATGNLLDAFATGNKAVNSASLTANTLSSTASVGNAQISNAAVSADNFASIPGYDSVAQPSVTGANAGGSAGSTAGYTSAVSGTTLTVADGETIVINLAGLSAADRVNAARYLEEQGFIVSGTTATTNGNGTYDLSAFGTAELTTGTGAGAGTFTFTGLSIDGFEGEPSAGGVITAVEGAISNSSVSVDGNAARGSAISNSAVNTLAVSTTALVADGGRTVAAGISTDSDTLAAVADYTIVNAQELGAAASSTTFVKSAFGVDQADGATVSDSSISVSGNSQFGEALGNTASNTLRLETLDGGNGATGVLASAQEGTGAEISATSSMEVFADVTASGSTVTLDSNRNTALAAVNNITNAVSVSATNVGDGIGSAFIGSTSTGADYVLDTRQSASGVLASSATTTIHNADGALTDLGGLSSSMLSISGNSTTAEATANRATNQMAIYSAADLGATAALTNRQDSATGVTATASSALEVDLNGGLLASDLVDASTVAIGGNVLTAMARGNFANNTLSFEAGATYSVGDASTVGPNVTASAAVLNDQSNTGNVTAAVLSGTFGLSLDNVGSTGSSSVQNSSLSATDNAVSAFAFGNSASNTLTLAALNTGMPSAAVSSSQFNQGAISASVSNVTFSMPGFGAGLGSSSNTSGNSVVAQAVGNSAFTVMGGR